MVSSDCDFNFQGSFTITIFLQKLCHYPAYDAAFERFKVDNNIEVLDLPYKFNQEADVRQGKP